MRTGTLQCWQSLFVSAGMLVPKRKLRLWQKWDQAKTEVQLFTPRLSLELWDPSCCKVCRAHARTKETAATLCTSYTKINLCLNLKHNFVVGPLCILKTSIQPPRTTQNRFFPAFPLLSEAAAKRMGRHWG